MQDTLHTTAQTATTDPRKHRKSHTCTTELLIGSSGGDVVAYRPRVPNVSTLRPLNCSPTDLPGDNLMSDWL